MKKIFQIGFNKCGTTSLCQYFLQNKVSSIHWEAKILNESRRIAQEMYNNIQLQNRILKGLDDHFVFFSDMEDFIKINNQERMFSGYTLFNKLYEQYPDSKFIFNTRNVEDWISSREKHARGIYFQGWCRAYNKSEQQIKEMWREHFYEHTNNVLTFFRDKPDSFLFFKLGESNHIDLYNFLHTYINLDDKIKLRHFKPDWFTLYEVY